MSVKYWNDRMTPDEIQAEMTYRITERLGIQLDDKPASLRQYIEAENEAKTWLERARIDGLIDEA